MFEGNPNSTLVSNLTYIWVLKLLMKAKGSLVSGTDVKILHAAYFTKP